MQKQQLTDFVIEQTLREIPFGYSVEAVTAVEMIFAHESQRGKYIKQIKGPALGLGQIEPATHDDIWLNGDSVWDNALKLGIISKFDYERKVHPKDERLLYDLRYTVFMVRQRLFMKPEKLPTEHKELSKYLKKHWNTVHGKADEYSYYQDWINWR